MLVYTAITSLDGFVADSEGSFEWSMPDAEVHGFINSLESTVGTYLLGRRMFEVMSAWETIDVAGLEPELVEFSALWHGIDKIIYSTTLQDAPTARSRIESSFDPESVRALVAASPRDVAIAGPTLAAHALRAGIVDEVRLFVSPVVVGGGIPAFSPGVSLDLELTESRRFANGVVFSRFSAAR